MEKIESYQNIVKNSLLELAKLIPSDEKISVETIFDDLRGHYLLMTVGWDDSRREYATLLHIDIKPNSKVYLQHDGTDLEFALRLAEKGIPTTDMVIAYRSPFQRQFFENFATA